MIIQALTILVEHPLTFGFIILCFLGLTRMTYDFILRLFGRKGMPVFQLSDDSDSDESEPPEPAMVPNPDEPDGILEAEEDVPCGKDKDGQEYVYNPDWNKELWRSHVDDQEEMKEKGN